MMMEEGRRKEARIHHEEGTRAKDEGTMKKEEARRENGEGRRHKEEGPRKKAEGRRRWRWFSFHPFKCDTG